MIDVTWWDQSFGNWDHGIFANVFEKHPEIFIQHNTKTPPIPKRAIVMASGKPKIEPLRQYLDKIESGVVILVSEEDAFFDWKKAVPKHLDVWTTYYHPSTKSEIKERVLLGAPYRIKDFKINKHLPKKYLWSFIGQSQNPFRQKAIEVMKGMDDGYLKIISSFGGYGEGGVDYQDYLDTICQSVYTVSPAGSMSTDAFRTYESLLCGSIPIVDKRSPRDDKAFNYWQEVVPDNKLISVEDWRDLPEILKQDHTFDDSWWVNYQNELEIKLLKWAK